MLRALPRQARRFSTDRRAIAALEFAIIAPFFFLIFIGTFELLLLMRTSEKLNSLAANVAQMVASSSDANGDPITTANLGDICTGAVQGLQPLPANGLTIDIVSMTITTPGTGAANTDDEWEYDFTGAGCTGAASGTLGASTACTLISNGGSGGMLPTTGGAKGDNAIVVRATLTYPGMVSFWLKTIPTLTQTAYSRWYHGESGTELTVTGDPAASKSC